MSQSVIKKVAVIVAHPDDETLWAGGVILGHDSWECVVICLCRKNDRHRATRFEQAMRRMNATGIMGDLDDEPEQNPIETEIVEKLILDLLPIKDFDLIITHNPNGEYTRHLRHEEVSKAVIQLWYRGIITTNELWTFAHEDGGRNYYPKPSLGANISLLLDEKIWIEKYNIITEIYGFPKNGWEAETTPKTEAFWQFKSPIMAKEWLDKGGKIN